MILPLLAALLLFEAVEPHMGTLFRIKLYAADQHAADTAFRAAFDRVRQLDETLSDYKPESELNRVVKKAVHHPTAVSADLFRVLETAQKIARASDGSFDITVGPLTHLWRGGKVPDAAAIQDALSRTGYRKLHLDSAKRTVTLDTEGMQLDAGGIAKGYATDQALATITAMGISSALVAASGDLAFSDAPPGQQGWRVGIDLADVPEANFTRVMELHNAAVSTSASSEQHLDSDGKRYSHILDPATGIGLTRDVRVTVIAPLGVVSDGLSTALEVMEHRLWEKGIACSPTYRTTRLADHWPGVAALIVRQEPKHPCVLESTRFGRIQFASGMPKR